MPGSGQFLFKPLALSVAFAMIAAFVLAMTFVPTRAAAWLKGEPKKEPKNDDSADSHEERSSGGISGFFSGLMGRIQAGIDVGIQWYTRQLERALRYRWWVVLGTVGALVLVLAVFGPILRREFFPEVDAGAFEMYVRLETGTRLEQTNDKIAEVEDFIRKTVGDDLETLVSQLGVWSDWSCAYTPNAGPMDAVVLVQLKGERKHSSQHFADALRRGMAADPRFVAADVAFNTGGTIRSALNEGRSTPIDVRIEGKDVKKSHELAEKIRQKLVGIDGIVDCRIMQRLNYPEYTVDVDRAKSRRLGLTQREVMENVVAALKSSIQYDKKNFWFDPVTHNQYYVGVQYPEKDITSMHTLLNVSITSPSQQQPIPLSDLVTLRATTMAAEVTHTDLMTTIDLSMNVEKRDLGHVADDIVRVLNDFGVSKGNSTWQPYDPDSKDHQLIEGSKIVLTGEYGHMLDTFFSFALGLVLAVLFIYFLMVVLLDSYLIPLVILSAAPIGLIGVVLVLWITGTAINVQSLLGVIFMVGIVVSNTVLMVDFAQNIRNEMGLSPTEAIQEAAAIRARPVVMTAIAALLALVPMALALERGSEANAPLGRAVIGGLLAGLVTTLVFVPALYSLIVRDAPKDSPSPTDEQTSATDSNADDLNDAGTNEPGL
jgi:multidrug efflux pump subunit AcrB